MQDQNQSILDKVLESKRQGVLFQPADIIDAMAEQLLDNREQEILRQRFGLGEDTYTLDAIGKRLGITRERVRQIAKQAISKLADGRKDFPELRQLDHALKEALEKSGGVREQQALLNEFFEEVRDEVQSAYLLFFLEHLSELIQSASFKKPSWQLVGAPVDLHDELEQLVHDYLKSQEIPQTISAIHSHVNSKPEFESWKQKFVESWPGTNDAIDWEYLIHAYLELSHQLAQNPFDEWGLANSSFVKPKRMGDKIYLVLKKNGDPIHFNRITEMINEYAFDKKKAYSPTVHNELILDDRFVLVGRGIYALQEWGYKDGTVADVLVNILKGNSEPMTRESLIESVLNERMVKEGTVILALNDKSRFKKLEDGRYILFEPSA